MDFKSTFLNWSWWVQPAPPASSVYLYTVVSVCAILFVTATVLAWRYRPTITPLQDYKRGWVQLLASCALGLVVLVFARWQGLAFLSLRVLQGGLACVFVILSLRLIAIRLFSLPQKIHAIRITRTLDTYLPKPKRK